MNDKNSRINTSNQYFFEFVSEYHLGDGIILKNGCNSTNSGTINGTVTESTTTNINVVINTVKTLLTLETDSSLTNSGTINGNYIQETGSSLTNSGTINEPSNNQS